MASNYHLYNGDQVPSNSYSPGLVTQRTTNFKMAESLEHSSQLRSKMEEKVALIPDLHARVSEMQGVLNQLLHDVQKISEHLSIKPTENHVHAEIPRSVSPSRQVQLDHESQHWRSMENQGQKFNSQRQSEAGTERMETKIQDPDPPSEPSQIAPVISAVTPDNEKTVEFSAEPIKRPDVQVDRKVLSAVSEKDKELSLPSNNLSITEAPELVNDQVLPEPQPVNLSGFPAERDNVEMDEAVEAKVSADQNKFSKLKCKRTPRSEDNRIMFLYGDGTDEIQRVEKVGSFRQDERDSAGRSEMSVEMVNCSSDSHDEPAVNVRSIPMPSVSSLQSSQQEFGNPTFENFSFNSTSNGSLRSSLKPMPSLASSLTSSLTEPLASSLTSSLTEPDDRPDGGSDLKILSEGELEELTLKEANRAADCTDHKSQGADTILCMDTSGSMEGQKFKQIKAFIESFIEGIEEVAVENSLEENIAMVTFGNKTRVVQNLTNDYSKIRDAVDLLETGGPSPIMTGLVLCMSAIYNRGGVVTFRERKIYPRIILLTDGGVTDQRIFNGPDAIVKQGGTKKEVWHKLMEFAERFRTHSDPRHFVCVPVGDDADMTLLGQLVNTAGGTIVQPENVKKLSHHFLINTVVAKIIHDGVLRGPELSDEDLKLKIKETEGGADFEDSEVEEALMMIQKDSELKAQGGATGGSDSSTMEAKEMPPIGSRVRRGPDWRWENQDDNLPGTVVAHKARGYLRVEWDNANHGKYRYGAESGAKDVRMVDEPRMLPPGMMVAVGVRARRGKDWDWGSQDGGEGSSGVIFKVEDSGIVHVRWDNAKRGNYRFGLFGKYDIEVCPQCIVSEGATGISGDTTPQALDEKTGQWQWQDKERRWRDHLRETSDKIEHIYQTRQGKGTVLVECENEKYRVILDKKCQRNVSTGTEVPIRRIEVTMT